jgi:hypothetical protein
MKYMPYKPKRLTLSVTDILCLLQPQSEFKTLCPIYLKIS